MMLAMPAMPAELPLFLDLQTSLVDDPTLRQMLEGLEDGDCLSLGTLSPSNSTSAFLADMLMDVEQVR